MKVAILTQPLGHNYGGLLQAYALQKFLSDQGAQVVTIDRRPAPAFVASTRTIARDALRFAAGRIQAIPTRRTRARMHNDLEQFRDQYLNMSPQVRSSRALRAYIARERFDAFIVGSDQVWRPRYSPNLYNFFLDFLNDVQTPASRVSYAASFGVDSWEFSAVETARCRGLLSSFDAVSVREESGIKLCREHLGRVPVHVPDPTFLVEPEVYHDLIVSHAPSVRYAEVLAYFLDYSEEKAKILRRVTDRLHLGSYFIKPVKGAHQVTRENFDECIYPSVPTWLQSFRDSRFIVTDSFHGVLFAIIFNKPFIAIGNSTRGLSRFQSLLSLFNLQNQLVENETDVTQEVLSGNISWTPINNVRVNQQALGRSFLTEALVGI